MSVIKFSTLQVLLLVLELGCGGFAGSSMNQLLLNTLVGTACRGSFLYSLDVIVVSSSTM